MDHESRQLLHDGTLCRLDDPVSEKRIYAALRNVQADIGLLRLRCERDLLFEKQCKMMDLEKNSKDTANFWSDIHQVSKCRREKTDELMDLIRQKNTAWYLIQELGVDTLSIPTYLSVLSFIRKSTSAEPKTVGASNDVRDDTIESERLPSRRLPT